MKTKFYIATLAMLLLAAPAVADDGELVRRNVSKTPSLETEHASLKMMSLYVPAQTSQGEFTTIEYNDAEGTLVESRDQAKPLITFYGDGHVESVEDSGGFSGHGHRDLYGAVSLDDGLTWKRTNLSKSGDYSSFTLKDGTAYPGDVIRLFDAVAGNKVMAVWASRYCRGGNPAYAMTTVETQADGTEVTVPVYEDLFGVGGSQKSSDFADEGYPTVGEVPYCCLWAARGTLEPVDDDGNYDVNGTKHAVIWRQAERLTSGVRDAHRMEVAGEKDVGFVVTWQEDPEGLRPGDGHGPGEGWSGAVAHHQTDIWYSYISWEDFDLVDVSGDPVALENYTEDGTPPVGLPMSMPVRLTDNAMCQDDSGGYCNHDFNGDGSAEFCAHTVTVNIKTPAEPDGKDIILCVTEDGRLLRGNIAATRARTNLRAYDKDGDGINDSAWVITAYEESKGLGEEEFDLGTANETEIGKMDLGKNIWYHTFDMFEPEIVSQGMMLNAPAMYPDDYIPPTVGGVPVLIPDGNYMIIEPDPIYGPAGLDDAVLYQTEIARRFSLLSQKGSQLGSSSRTSAFTTWKQGIKRQGGPADIMARRFVVPAEFDPLEDNPYAYENMVCGTWKFTDGTNPRYVRGLCMDQPINMSATTITECDSVAVNEDGECTGIEAFPWNERFDDIDFSLLGEDSLPKITWWEQTGPSFEGDLSVPGNFDDVSWENPYDVAKGHRGYIDGDFIMLLYAWSPNWLANTVGHDNYNLYIRRSFDGGQTWTTTPDASPWTDVEGVVADGTTTCEWMGPAGGIYAEEFCTTYAAGEFEQARNVSQLVGTGETVLDPRYAPTSPLKSSIVQEDGTFLYPDDERDPSKFFAVFETGDNTTVEFGEAEPLDLFYSRAFNWGDDYELVETTDEVTGETSYYFDWLEGSSKIMSGEASVAASPGGDFFYAIWNQETLNKFHEVIESDAWFRRIMFLDEDVVTPPSGGGGGGGKN